MIDIQVYRDAFFENFIPEDTVFYNGALFV